MLPPCAWLCAWLQDEFLLQQLPPMAPQHGNGRHKQVAQTSSRTCGDGILTCVMPGAVHSLRMRFRVLMTSPQRALGARCCVCVQGRGVEVTCHGAWLHSGFLHTVVRANAFGRCLIYHGVFPSWFGFNSSEGLNSGATVGA